MNLNNDDMKLTDNSHNDFLSVIINTDQQRIIDDVMSCKEP